ncbi:superfamily II DNA/RNA helicase [Oikeobacillus pervagus]|uniref:Superfamily II DNA/RNA helicase n=1 Tax=Oikeobacillus pervagus TaxID=1325931 RepID=A0AAJ1WLA3_9BACI|nr:DEAD/DEAH box helicase [Oikeobacillus pervagus]MDQ0215986.1 superfamily II DNA/RNA helicase [Oikeobacillus pervagus]
MDTNQKTSWTTLQILKPFIQEAWKESSFAEPTPVQKQAVPIIMEGEDVICESPTGTGKTIAYLLPILNQIDEQKKGLQVVILAPSRELVMQIAEEIRKWTKGSGIVSTSLIGGANIKKQVEKLKKKPQIIVGTTGRIMELIKMKKLKMHEVKTIVVDEFDMLIEQEHIQHITNIIKSTLKERQLLFFSATISEKTKQFANEWMKDPKWVKINREDSSNNVEHLYVVCEQRDKVDVLRKILHTSDMKALAFIKNTDKLFELESKLKYKGISLEILGSEAKKKEREQALKKFRTGEISLLLTTDVAARGLDIAEITHVFHVDFPSKSNQYIHRSGRTGRMGAKGTVISLVTKREESFLEKMSSELQISFKKKRLFKGKLIDEK